MLIAIKVTPAQGLIQIIDIIPKTISKALKITPFLFLDILNPNTQ